MEPARILAERWVSHRVRASLITPLTGRNQRSHLHYYVAAHGSNQSLRIDRRIIERWLDSIGHLSPSSRRSHVSTIRSFLTWTIAEGRIEGRVLDQLPHVKVPRSVPRALSRDQVVRLLRTLRTDRERVVVGLMLWCGLRCGEVARLRVEDIDEHDGLIHVTGKAGHQRMICLPDELAPVIERWLDVRRRVPGPLVLTRWNAPFSADTISGMVSKLMVDAGVKVAPRDGRSAHALRHTAASDVLERGAHITTVQAMLGHMNLSTTATYLRRARLEDLRSAMNGRTYGPTEEGAA